ncbi:hypothetical protein GCM10010327_18910 [Streptomyces nitrosporeus]|nr:hypothetical protein GCM10010327_18910 [Streptomyces nitrosporeus]
MKIRGVAVKALIRRVAVSAALVATAASLSACSSDTEPVASVQPAASAPVAQPTEEASPSASPGPVIAVGESGKVDVVDTDEYGENPTVVTQLDVTVKSVEYVTPADIDTTNEPEHGQFARLTLTVKNVGRSPGDFSAYGMMKWESDDVAAQDASTLEELDGPDLNTTYKPGQAVTGSLVLDVGAKGGTVSYWGRITDSAPSLTIALPTS